MELDGESTNQRAATAQPYLHIKRKAAHNANIQQNMHLTSRYLNFNCEMTSSSVLTFRDGALQAAPE